SVDPEYKTKKLKPLNDRFCLAEACLLADVVQYLEDQVGPGVYYPRAVVEDVLNSIRHVHVTGLMHEKVLSNIGRW
ncbi:unnamed protein product, partial [Discosporangium mesarthrocarpum]